VADTRGKILDAATELFARDGYDATSIREIAEKAGVATGLLHHHFGNKAAVLAAVSERISTWAKDYRRAKAATHVGQSLEERVRGFVHETFEMACLKPQYCRLIGMAMYSQEIWEEAGLGELLWETLAVNLGELVEEYVEAYPEAGMPAVMQTGVGVFGACLSRCLVGRDGVAADERSQRERDRAWCAAMTRIWTRLLLPVVPGP
jgi:AcrR family transcriptional regulator